MIEYIIRMTNNEITREESQKILKFIVLMAYHSSNKHG